MTHGVCAATLRELNNLAFVHRERARFRAGTSELLGVTLEPSAGDGIVVDVRGLGALHAVARGADGAGAIGAFASLAAVGADLPELCAATSPVAALRLRLVLREAGVTVYGAGATRVVPLDALALAPHELPVAIAVPPLPVGLGLAERRRATNDGASSFALGVSVALLLSAQARLDRVRILIDLDGEVVRAAAAEALLEGRRCERDRFAEVGRAAAAAIAATDARSSAIARALQPLVVAALRDALASART